MLTCTWPFPKSMYGPNMQFTSDGDVLQRAQCIYQSEVKVHVLHTASEVNRTILSAARPTRPPPGKCMKKVVK